MSPDMWYGCATALFRPMLCVTSVRKGVAIGWRILIMHLPLRWPLICSRWPMTLLLLASRTRFRELPLSWLTGKTCAGQLMKLMTPFLMLDLAA